MLITVFALLFLPNILGGILKLSYLDIYPLSFHEKRGSKTKCKTINLYVIGKGKTF